jgi:hypothetical protein
MIALLLFALAAASSPAMKQDLQTLRSSTVRAEVGAAAERVAASNDPAALRELGDLLATREFLARLDDLANPMYATMYLRQVFHALEARPSQMTEALCLRVAASPDFVQGGEDRMGYGLPALAAVRPMSADAQALFRKMNAEGYFNFNGPYLAANGSERAVALLESMFAERSQRVIERVELAHTSVVPNRTKLAIVRMVDRLWQRPLEKEVRLALAESLFEYRGDEWYGKRRNPPVAPSWSTATPEARAAAAALARKLSKERDLPASLRAAAQAASRP